MKKIIILIGLLAIQGCAKEHYTQYVESVKKRDATVATVSAKAQTEQYKAWSNAIVKAGESGNQGALVALAMSRPAAIIQPVQQIKAPTSAADYLRAATPAVGIVAGAWAGGKIIDALAGASGIHNNIRAAGDVKQNTVIQKNVAGDASADTCIGCQKGENDMPKTDEKGSGACTSPAIYGGGVFWYDKVGSCSCASHAAGHC